MSRKDLRPPTTYKVDVSECSVVAVCTLDGCNTRYLVGSMCGGLRILADHGQRAHPGYLNTAGRSLIKRQERIARGQSAEERGQQTWQERREQWDRERVRRQAADVVLLAALDPPAVSIKDAEARTGLPMARAMVALRTWRAGQAVGAGQAAGVGQGQGEGGQ